MEWISLNHPIPMGPIYDHEKDHDHPDHEADSMRKRKLIKAGTVIRTFDAIDGRTEFLVGHINELGGVCDDCNIGRDTKVVAYKVVWEEVK